MRDSFVRKIIIFQDAFVLVHNATKLGLVGMVGTLQREPCSVIEVLPCPCACKRTYILLRYRRWPQFAVFECVFVGRRVGDLIVEFGRHGLTVEFLDFASSRRRLLSIISLVRRVRKLHFERESEECVSRPPAKIGVNLPTPALLPYNLQKKRTYAPAQISRQTKSSS